MAEALACFLLFYYSTFIGLSFIAFFAVQTFSVWFGYRNKKVCIAFMEYCKVCTWGNVKIQP